MPRERPGGTRPVEFPFNLTDSERRGHTRPVQFPQLTAALRRSRMLANACKRFANAWRTHLLTPNFKTGTEATERGQTKVSTLSCLNELPEPNHTKKGLRFSKREGEGNPQFLHPNPGRSNFLQRQRVAILEPTRQRDIALSQLA